MMPVGAVTHTLGHEFRGPSLRRRLPAPFFARRWMDSFRGIGASGKSPGRLRDRARAGRARLLTEIARTEDDQALRVNVLAKGLGDLRRC
jgi:hypothetical protein